MKQQPTKRVLSTEEVTLINERADAVFKAHPTVEQLYACIDGQLFFTKEKNAAENHARRLKQAELIVVTKGGELKTEEAAAKETFETGEKLAEAKSEVGSPKSEAEQPVTELADGSQQLATEKAKEETGATKTTKDKKDKK